MRERPPPCCRIGDLPSLSEQGLRCAIVITVNRAFVVTGYSEHLRSDFSESHACRSLEPGRQPCVLCAKMVINSRVARVVYAQSYPDGTALQFLKQAGIDVERP